jgi:Amt family ammonium transporter
MSSNDCEFDGGDTAWLLSASAMVCVMTLGLGFFYGGLIRYKNLVTTIGYIFVVYAVVNVMWYFLGFTFLYGPAAWSGGFIGNFDYGTAYNVGKDTNCDYAPTYPFLLLYFFELQFAAITGGLLLGGFVERVRLLSFSVFIAIWLCLVYAVIGCWMWNHNGWLSNLGAFDFAGGCAVEINCGFSSMGASLVIGHRKEFRNSKPSNIPLALLGLALLWFGWLGFNGGTANAADGLAVSCCVVTNMAGSMGAIAWMATEWYLHKKVSMIGFASGAVAGLVAITPSCGYVDIVGGFFIGTIAGIICCLCALWHKTHHTWDDPLDMWAVHGIGGCWGVFSIGFFATPAINPIVTAGVFYGGPFVLILKQLLAVVCAAGWSCGMSAGITFILQRTMGMRVEDHEEHGGLDAAIHQEVAVIYEKIGKQSTPLLEKDGEQQPDGDYHPMSEAERTGTDPLAVG